MIGLDGKSFTGKKQIALYQFGEIKVGVFGLVNVKNPQYSISQGKLHFMSFEQTAKISAEELRNQGADVIVALTHSNMNEDRALARTVPEMDLI